MIKYVKKYPGERPYETREEIESEIQRVRIDLSILDQYGFGHQNTLAYLCIADNSYEAFDKPLPKEIIAKARKVKDEQNKLLEESHKKAYEELGKSTTYEWLKENEGLGDPQVTFANAVVHEFVNKNEAHKWRGRIEELWATEYFAERGRKIAEAIKEVHEEYIAFLESCLPNQ